MPELKNMYMGFGGELWYIKEIHDKHYIMGAAYNDHPDRYLTKTGMEDMIKTKMLKLVWTHKEAKEWT